MTRILVVEDEQSFREGLQFMLTKEGFEVVLASDGSAGIAEFDKSSPDLVLLDWMLPELPGIEVCKYIRSKSAVPVIMLTAKDTEVDKVVGLELGADDYVTKPFSTPELMARIRAVLRRGGDFEAPNAAILEIGPIRLDVERHTIAINGEPTSMPLKEFELLEYLMRNAGRVLTRGQLMDRIWGSNYHGDGKTLDVHVKRIRTKIEPDPANPIYLTTVRGLGYRFES
ncbi:MAG: response regulator transcription factor [Actinomycetales bacterium]|nr:response regulator transcription factor [Actinomycetales bacterium]